MHPLPSPSVVNGINPNSMPMIALGSFSMADLKHTRDWAYEWEQVIPCACRHPRWNMILLQCWHAQSPLVNLVFSLYISFAFLCIIIVIVVVVVNTTNNSLRMKTNVVFQIKWIFWGVFAHKTITPTIYSFLPSTSQKNLGTTQGWGYTLCLNPDSHF